MFFGPTLMSNGYRIEILIRMFSFNIKCYNRSFKDILVDVIIVTTLALGSRPKQGLARVRAKKEAWESQLMRKRVWGNEPSHFLVNSHFGSSSPNGFSKFQKEISRVKIHWIETFLISLESSWNLNVWNGFAWPIWTSETQVMAKRRVESQIDNLTPDH
jgi:hypothetical protein